MTKAMQKCANPRCKILIPVTTRRGDQDPAPRTRCSQECQKEWSDQMEAAAKLLDAGNQPGLLAALEYAVYEVGEATAARTLGLTRTQMYNMMKQLKEITGD